MTEHWHDHATPPELRGLPRSSYVRSHALPAMNPEPITPTVQVVYSSDGRAARLQCRQCGNRTTSIWTEEMDEWLPSFLARHDGARDCSVPDYGEGE